MPKTVDEIKKELADAIVERDGGITNENASELLALGKSIDTASGEINIAGSVGLSVHINMGSFCNFDIRVEGVNGNHARALIQQEAETMIPIVTQIMKQAMKVAQSLKY